MSNLNKVDNFTGFKDKNGRCIYLDDLVKSKYYNTPFNIGISKKETSRIYKVGFRYIFKFGMSEYSLLDQLTANELEVVDE